MRYRNIDPVYDKELSWEYSNGVQLECEVFDDIYFKVIELIKEELPEEARMRGVVKDILEYATKQFSKDIEHSKL